MWTRMRQRIAGLFSRKPRDESEVSHDVAVADAPVSLGEESVEATEPSHVDADRDVVWIESNAPSDVPVEAPPVAEIPDEPPIAVAPPDDFKFPWTRPEKESSTPTFPEEIVASEVPVAEEVVADRVFEPLPDELDAIEETFISVEHALPAAVQEVPAPPKRGLFARMFGRRAKEVPREEEDIADTNEHAVEAAANALDEVAEEVFPPHEETPTAAADFFAPVDTFSSDDAFASVEEPIVPTEEMLEPAQPVAEQPLPLIEGTFETVEDAFPAAEDAPTFEPAPTPTPTLLEEPPARDKRPSFIGRLFARKPKQKPRPSLEIEIHEDRIEAAAHALDHVAQEAFPSVETTDAPADEEFASFEQVEQAVPANELRFAPPPVEEEPEQESRDTLEVAQESRDTVDVAQDSRSTVEVEQADSVESVSDFGETLEIEEKTDEFEIVTTADTQVPAEGEDFGTLEVSKQSWIARLLGLKKKEKLKEGQAPGGATVVEGNPVFLFSKFRAFYNEIIRFKHQKSEFTAGFATAIVTDYSADLSPDAAADSLSKKLMEMLELQAAESKWMGGEAGDRYPDAQYAMAALADETFTHMEWEGQGAWPKQLLEVKLYKTHAADVELFRRIDKLLKDKPNSPVARDMARVYLLVIAAGFQGKYRPFGLTRALADYRQRLFEYIHSGDALMLYAPDRRIFPDAASRTLEGHAISRFTAAQRWAAILIFLVTTYTVIAHVAWNRVSADLKDVTARIKSGNTTAGAR